MIIIITGTTQLAKDLECDLLGSFPLDPCISESTDKGTPIAVENISSDLSKVYQAIAKKVMHFIDKNPIVATSTKDGEEDNKWNIYLWKNNFNNLYSFSRVNGKLLIINK